MLVVIIELCPETTFRAGDRFVLGFLWVILDKADDSPKNRTDCTKCNRRGENRKQRLRSSLN